MKDLFKRTFSVLLAVMLLFMHFTVTFAGGAYLVIKDIQTEYRYGEEFSAYLNYCSADGKTYGVKPEQCEIIGFDSHVNETQEQSVVIRYRDAEITCHVIILVESELLWEFNESSGELIVNGKGAMPEYDDGCRPWEEYIYDIKAITITGELTTISRHAFEGCSEATILNIEAAVHTIHSHAFENCHRLRNIFMPESLTMIEEFAFEHCHEIENIFYYGFIEQWDSMERYDEFINNGRVSFDCNTMNVCFNETFDYQNDSIVDIIINTHDGMNIFIDTYIVEGFNKELYGEQEVIVKFGPYQYIMCVRMDEAYDIVILFENVKTEYNIGEEFYAEVYECVGDERIYIPLEECVIEGFDSWCEGWQTVTLSYGGYTEIFEIEVKSEQDEPELFDWRYNMRNHELTIAYVGDGLYFDDEMPPWEADISNLDQVYTITITGRFNTIGERVFRNYNNLMTVNIEAEIDKICYDAFDNCHNIRNVFLPDSVTFIDEYAFNHSSMINNVFYRGNEEQWYSVDVFDEYIQHSYKNYNCVKLGEYVVANIKTEYEYGEAFFADVYLLKYGDLEPDSIDSIEVYGFDSNISGYQNVTLIYDEYEQSFEVYVNEPEEITIVDVSFENVKEEYEYGEEFYVEVIVHYSDGTSEYVNDFNVEGFYSSKPGKQNVTIRYCDYFITVIVFVNDDKPSQPSGGAGGGGSGSGGSVETEPVIFYNADGEKITEVTLEVGESFYFSYDITSCETDEYETECYSTNPSVAQIVNGNYVYAYKAGETEIIVDNIESVGSLMVFVTEPAVVEPENMPTVSVSTEECMSGNTIDVVVSLSDNTGFTNLELEIEYDTALNLVAVTPNETVGTIFTPAETLDTRPFNMSFNSEDNIYYNGDLVILTFEVPEDTEPGEYFINVDFYKGINGDYIDGVDVNYDADENPIDIQYVNGAVNVYNHIAGDINGDGVVNNKDANMLLKYLAGWNLDGIVEEALDVTGDGRLNSKDGTRLLRYLAHWDVTIY